MNKEIRKLRFIPMRKGGKFINAEIARNESEHGKDIKLILAI